VDVACNTDVVKKGNTDFVCAWKFSRVEGQEGQQRGNDEATMSAAVEAGGQG
jgi:hypothetical protein